MTLSEKAALAWLELFAGPGAYGDATDCARTIKRMLAEPRLPAEPTPDMLRAIEGGFVKMGRGPLAETGYRALYAHLTKPKTKKAWAVGCGLGFVHFDTLDDALEAAGVEVKAGRVVTIAHEEVLA